MRFFKKIAIILVILGFPVPVSARKIGTSAPKTEPKIQVKKEEPKKIEEKKVVPVKPQLFEIDKKYYELLDAKNKIFKLKKSIDDKSMGVWIRLKSGDVPMVTEDGNESNFTYVSANFSYLLKASPPEDFDFSTMINPEEE